MRCCDTRWKMTLVFKDIRWTFFFLSSVPLACNPQTQPAEQEQPETSPSPHYSKACPPRYPYAAVSSTGAESVCA